MTQPAPFILEAEGVSLGSVVVRLARTEAELKAAQRLRYKVFYEECGAIPHHDIAETQCDHDDFDAVADHLIVLDTAKNEVVGNYRLLREDAALKLGSFYTQTEYAIDKLLHLGKGGLLELGRSCIHAEYRTRNVLQLLWQGIAEYIAHYNITCLFGCASFQGTNPDDVADGLSYLYHHHRAPETYCPTALPNQDRVEMNRLPPEAIDAKAVFNKLPPLLKGYLRVGAFIGNGAIIDHAFNTIDVCVVVETARLPERYRKHYNMAPLATTEAAQPLLLHEQATAAEKSTSLKTAVA